MQTTVVTPPSVAIVSTEAMKRYLGLYQDLDEQDADVADAVADATAYVETITDRAFSPRILKTDWDSPPYEWCGALRLPVAPVASVESVEAIAADGSASLVDPSAYRVEVGTPGRVVFLATPTWPSAGYRVRYQAGWTDPTGVPSQARRVVKLLAANWFETRRPIITGTIVSDLPFGVPQLLGQLRWGNYPQ